MFSKWHSFFGDAHKLLLFILKINFNQNFVVLYANTVIHRGADR